MAKRITRCKSSADIKYQSCLDSARQRLKSRDGKKAQQTAKQAELFSEKPFIYLFIFMLLYCYTIDKR